jgi:hypothetical protein
MPTAGRVKDAVVSSPGRVSEQTAGWVKHQPGDNRQIRDRHNVTSGGLLPRRPADGPELARVPGSE